ncbi:MAG TPA: cellulase family glycosylhydrolase [Microvirga sp.]|jgi:aryl-phospho-beta-D-glucosidase BglC (GH1 family)
MAGFRTQGNQILDENGQPFQIRGVNWSGFETPNFVPDGLHVRNYADIINQMANLGFNTLRIPLSTDFLDPGRKPRQGSFDTGNANKELAGLTSLDILDAIVTAAAARGMKVILDHHRNDAGAGAAENGLWYIPGTAYTEDRWVSFWTKLAAHYKGNSTVIGADLHNEPSGSVNWYTWAAAAEKAGNAIHKINPDWLIIVEGVQEHNGQSYWWGGNLMGVRERPVSLDVKDRVVYSPHDYPHSIYWSQPWTFAPNFPDNLPGLFDQMWGYIYKENIAPIYIGEMGSRFQDPRDVAWFSKIRQYIGGDFDTNGSRDIPAGNQGISWSWWALNPNSSDTGGILQDDWYKVDRNKYLRIYSMLPGGTVPPGEIGIPTSGDDEIIGTPINDQIGGGDGNDTLIGGAGNDTLNGENGNDKLYGEAGNDKLEGGSGNDLLYGGEGQDAMEGGTGDDTYVVDSTGDKVWENFNSGTDTVQSWISYTLTDDVEHLQSADPNSTYLVELIGNKLNNVITGSAGPNHIDGRGGADTMQGLGGNDTYYVDNRADVVVEGPGQGWDTVFSTVTYALSRSAEVEVLRFLSLSSKANLALTGSDTANEITGNAGKNTLKGMGGNDIIAGRQGHDTLAGGKGKDKFLFNTKPSDISNVDRITDYVAKDDSLWLDNAVFKGLGKAGSVTKPAKLKASMFTVGPAAADETDRVIYDRDAGVLYYDPDGTGAAAQVRFALVKPGLALGLGEFLVV